MVTTLIRQIKDVLSETLGPKFKGLLGRLASLQLEKTQVCLKRKHGSADQDECKFHIQASNKSCLAWAHFFWILDRNTFTVCQEHIDLKRALGDFLIIVCKHCPKLLIQTHAAKNCGCWRSFPIAQKLKCGTIKEVCRATVTCKGPFSCWRGKDARNWAAVIDSRKIKFNSHIKEKDRRESLLNASCNACLSYSESQQCPQTPQPQQTHVLSSHRSSPCFFGWHRVTYWQLSVTPSEHGHRGATSFRECNCWEKSSWPDTCKEARNRRRSVSNM